MWNTNRKIFRFSLNKKSAQTKVNIKHSKNQLNPDPIYSRDLDVADLPSQYTEDIETFRQVLNIPDPRDSMPVFSASV